VIQNSTAPLTESYTPTGIYLSDTGDRIYNNSFIDNERQAFVLKNRSNTWNTSTIGNLWSDYNGTGYYVIDENNTDYLPRGLERASIQDRINNASQGDTINISAGTYNENVTVNKTVTLIGTDVEVIGLNPFNVTEADVKISDFVITGTDYETSTGILTGANTTIDNCTVTNSRYAIKFGADNCTVKNTLLTDNLYGIYAFKKTNQEIYGNQILSSYQGICLMGGNGTEIHDNVIQNSTAPHGSDIPTGIFLSDTDDLIYNNSFIDNTRQAFVYENRSNTWNTSTIGNLWSDYNGTGYYIIDENNTDYLPRSLSVGFDTGEGTYPSISGTHNGTIKPSHNFTVNGMYTYPCAGTGGHTESIELYESGILIANGTWNGYSEDNQNVTIHNVTGASYVTLLKDHEYSYTIKTGSYPQIIHESRKEVTGGTIICDKFTDANGNIYTDWIPAIRLGYKNEENATDYSKSEHWLSLPASVDKKVDVFFLYPTAWQKVNNSDPNICDIDNPSMLIGAKIAFYKDATAFETAGNIYAPYYRQADGKYTMSLPSLEEQDKFAGGIPKSDVFAAFDYYIKNYNNGRPFIIASHSQGAVMARFLLSEYMKENPKVYNRMIAAYVIGYSVTDEYLAENPHLKFAEGPNDTGVIISYNTEAPGVTDNPLVFPGAISINPITWTREETLATTEQSLGSRVINAQLQAVFMKNYADAQVNKTRGTVITTTVDAKTSNTVGLPDGVYHPYDYPFYYYNLRENAENRVKNFLSKQSTNN